MENQDVKPSAVVHAATVSDDEIRRAFSIRKYVCCTITDAINADFDNGYIVTGCTYLESVGDADMFAIYVSNGKEDDQVASVTIERPKSGGVWKCSGIHSCGDRIHRSFGHLADEFSGNDRLVRLIGHQAEIVKMMKI